MIRYIKNAIQAYIKQVQAQNRLDRLFGFLRKDKNNKEEYVKISVPERFISMIEVCAIYGIKDGVELLDILEKHIQNEKDKRRN